MLKNVGKQSGESVETAPKSIRIVCPSWFGL